MKKAELVQAMFTQEEIAAINTKNIKLEEENKKLKSDVSVYKSQMNAYEKKYLALLKANT